MHQFRQHRLRHRVRQERQPHDDRADDPIAAQAHLVRAWWQRYGPAWAAIRHDILPEFTPAELQAAAAARPADSLLDLAERLREQP